MILKALELSTFVGSMIIRSVYRQRIEKRLIKEGYMDKYNKYNFMQALSMLAQVSVLTALPIANMIIEACRLIDEDIFYELEKNKRSLGGQNQIWMTDFINYINIKKEIRNEKNQKEKLDNFFDKNSSSIKEDIEEEKGITNVENKTENFDDLSIKDKKDYLNAVKEELNKGQDDEDIVENKDDKPKVNLKK